MMKPDGTTLGSLVLLTAAHACPGPSQVVGSIILAARLVLTAGRTAWLQKQRSVNELLCRVFPRRRWGSGIVSSKHERAH